MFSKIFAIILVVSMFGGFGVGVIYAFNERGQTFYGTETFETYQQEVDYLNKIISEAQLVGAKVNDFNLSIQSPPKVEWQVRMPQNIWDNNTQDFKYGERLTLIHTARVTEIVFGSLCFIAVVVMVVLIFKDKKMTTIGH
jgi:hypothetical protein